jgi:hypothetical protein
MSRASVYVVFLVVLLAGCGGSRESNDGSAGSDASSTSPSSPRDSELPTESTGGTVPEESDRPTSGNGDDDDDDDGDGDGNGDGDDEDERVLEVGGPTLDNTYPTNPFALPYVGGSSCILFSNRTSDVTVTVHSVRLVNLQPPGDPGLALGTEPSGHPQCSNSPGEQTWTVHANCSEANLEPNATTACPVEVRSIGTLGTD